MELVADNSTIYQHNPNWSRRIGTEEGRQRTIANNAAHQKHWANFLYKDGKFKGCPCEPCLDK